MRVLIVSDTHKKHENLITIMEKERPFDRMIHLGDAEGYEGCRDGSRGDHGFKLQRR